MAVNVVPPSHDPRPGHDDAPVRISQTGWTARRDLDIDEWTASGRLLGGMGRSSQWGIGDWIRYGNAKFGERYKRASEITGYDPQTLMNMVHVASRFEVSRRRETLSWSHHEVVAGLSTAEQDRWLNLAVREGWQRGHLRSLLRGAREGAKAPALQAHHIAGAPLPDRYRDEETAAMGVHDPRELDEYLDDPPDVAAVEQPGDFDKHVEDPLEIAAAKPLRKRAGKAKPAADHDADTRLMSSPLHWALLGLVIECPSYAYELVQRFERTYDGLLSLSSPSHIYTAIDVLTRRGMIEVLATDAIPDAAVRQRQLHYGATTRGRSAYEQYLVEQVTDERRRARLLAVEIASLAREPERAIDVLQRYGNACDQDTAEVQPAAGGVVDLKRRLIAELVGDSDRLLREARHAWAALARERVSELRAVESAPALGDGALPRRRARRSGAAQGGQRAGDDRTRAAGLV